jgi:deoxyribodipyrimidine photo-lyase
MEKLNILWLRRDLRLEDNTALKKAHQEGLPVLALFIFDSEILDPLDENDARVTFIHEQLYNIDLKLKEQGSSLCVKHGNVGTIWEELTAEYEINCVYSNEDYEAYGIMRDASVKESLSAKGISFLQFKDHVIHSPGEVLLDNGNPYKVYTHYMRKWRTQYLMSLEISNPSSTKNWSHHSFQFPTLSEIGFIRSSIKVVPFKIKNLNNYAEWRDFPSQDITSYLSPHLRFGTISIRQLVEQVKHNEVFLNELIWREFFMQVLFHFPHSEKENFKKQYDDIHWRNNEAEFELWTQGKTGYPLVDAGMRQLNASGYMHNRVRMVVASFLCKHLLIEWQWGERYFASKLLDFELSSNVGNWQWSAGTGCDAAPYFRVFNPHEQLKKFDKNLDYVKKWLPEYGTDAYPHEIVEHKYARQRALDTYKIGINK